MKHSRRPKAFVSAVASSGLFGHGQALPVVLITVALFGCSKGGGSVFGSGTVEATEIIVSAEVPGRVITVQGDEGRRVEKDELLVGLEPTDYELELAQGRQRLVSAEAALAMLLEGAREEDVQQASAEVSRAREQLELARRRWERTQALYESGSATTSERDAAETGFRQAEAGLQAARAAYEGLLAARPQEVQRAQASVEEARIAVSRLQNRLEDTSVTSPREGTIITRFVEEGEYVVPGSPLFRIADLSIVYLTIYVPGPLLSQVRLDQPVAVTVDGVRDREFSGRIRRIADEAEFTPRNAQTEDERAQLVYAVEIEVPNPEGIFKIGMPADARIPARSPGEHRG